MKRLIYAGLIVLTLIVGWSIPTAQAQLKYAALSIAQAFTALQTFSGGITSLKDWTLTDPTVAPTIGSTASGGSCSGTTVFRVYYSWTNPSGETLLSTASSDLDPAGVLAQLTITPPAPPAAATGWRAWFSRSTDSHVLRYGCGTNGDTPVNDVAVTVVNCPCKVTAPGLQPTANATHVAYGLKLANEYSTRPELLVKEVCRAGCRYTTVAAALADISDNSTSRRYLLLLQPGDYYEKVTLKSYVSIAGTDRATTRIMGNGLVATGGVEISADVTEVSISNLTIGGTNALKGIGTSTVRTKVYVSNVNLGIIDGTSYPTKTQSSFDCIRDDSGLRDFFVSGAICRTVNDGFVIGTGDRFYNSGVTYAIEDADYGAAVTSVRLWLMGLAAGNAAAELYESNFIVNVRMTRSDSSAVVRLLDLEPQGTPATGTIVDMSGGIVTVSTVDTGSNDIIFAYLGATVANSAASTVTIRNVRLTISSPSSSSALKAVDIVSDVDHANWTVNWTGGSISLSGGATRTDVNNAETVGGFLLSLSGIDHAGVYTGAGTVSTADTRSGKFSTALSAGFTTFTAGTNLVGTKCVNIDPASATTDWLFWRTPAALTVTHVRCIVDAATSTVLTLRECNGDGASCGATEAAITCATTTTSEASSIDDPAVAANVWMRVLRGTVTGAPAQASLCMEYTVP